MYDILIWTWDNYLMIGVILAVLVQIWDLTQGGHFYVKNIAFMILNILLWPILILIVLYRIFGIAGDTRLF